MIAHLDTHVVVSIWVRDRRMRIIERLIVGAELFVSPAVVLELQILHELGRVHDFSGTILSSLNRDLGLGISDTSFLDVVEHGRRLGWTRDPFDRFIVGHAIADDALLITADETILGNFERARWK